MREKVRRKVRKAIIPVAGLGTRFLPATKAQPKEMLPVVDKPVIQYIVEEAVASGIEEVIFVTGRNKRAIEDHFDDAAELEHELEERGKRALATEMKRISRLAKFAYVRQREPRGDGDAILSALHLVGDEPVAILHGDNIVDGKEPCLKQLIRVFEEEHSSVVALETVQKKDVSRFGIIKGSRMGNNRYALQEVVEKPSPAKAPSRLAIVAQYVVTPEVLSLVKTTRPVGGELRLADVLDRFLKRGGKMVGVVFEGKRYDCGSKEGFLEATVEFGLRHPETKASFRRYLRSMLY